MPLRSSARLLAAAGALLIAAPVLTSCGFDYATDRDYTPGAATNDRDGLVDVLGAAVISGQEGSGTFIASFANNVEEDTASVTGMTGTTADGGTLTFDSFSPIEVPAGGLVNLATDGGVTLTGDFTAGDFLEITVTFTDGNGDEGSVDLEVPTYTPCGDYAGLDTSAGDDASDTSSEDPCAVESPDTETEH